MSGGSSRAKTPGAKTASDVTTPTISRSWYPRHAIDSVITVSGLTFQQWTGSTWSEAAASGTLDYEKIRVIATSSSEYETTTQPTITIDGTEYIFYVTTPVDPSTLNATFPYTFPFNLE